MRRVVAALLIAAGGTGLVAQKPPSRWWMDEPIRFLQTNLRETDSTVDPKTLVEQVASFPANTLLLNMGGIVAQYPTRVAFHYPSRMLPQGRDLFGEVLEIAHARRMRVVGRFDLSKTQKAVYDAHPEWFFKGADGGPYVYNGLYSTCINGGYYRQHALEILSEALERYPVDGLFFNMFGNPSSDYSGRAMGPCQCDACRARFQAKYGRPLPATGGDRDYGAFLSESAREVAASFAELIHRKRPGAAFLTYLQAHTDGIMSESNTAARRPLPLWPYSASDNVNRARNSEPDKMAFNLSMAFVDYPWRFVSVPSREIELRLYQNLAHGGPPAIAMVGTMDQEDRQSLIGAQLVFRWHAAHEDLYVGQHSAARVLLLGGGNQAAYRGFFRLLTEQHIPFAVSDNLRWLDDSPRSYDVVVAPSGAPAALDRYVRDGGRVLAAGPAPPAIPIARVVGRRDAIQGAWRVHDRALLPSLANTNLLFLDGEFAELAPVAKPALTLIPPAMFGPPEKVWADKTETTIPGLVVADYGRGRMAWVPWDVGGLYYRHSSPGHAGLMTDLIDHLLPHGRQLQSDAHPLVEITLMRQAKRNRMLVHLVNASGHADTAYFAPVEMRNITVQVAAEFRTARSVSSNRVLDVTRDGRYARIIIPLLKAYEVIVLE
jgi:Hypothetical glycosyl hydrolase 6